MGEVNWKDSYEAARVELKRAEVWFFFSCSCSVFFRQSCAIVSEMVVDVRLIRTVCLYVDVVEGATREYEKGIGQAEKVD